MATNKRSLYKQATQDTVVPKGKRKTLAQGRLVIHAEASSVHDVNQLEDENAKTGFKDLGKNEAVGKFGPSASLSMNDLYSELQTENVTTPRKKVPQVLVHDSPNVAKPTSSLDLSDTEDEEGKASEVIVIDANDDPRNLNDREVDVSVHYTNSPAKVVCHLPSRVYGDLRNTGNVELAARVNVDQVPSAYILSEEGNNFTESENKSATSRRKTPAVIREKGIVGNTSDPKPAMKSSVGGIHTADDINQRKRAVNQFSSLTSSLDSRSHEIDSSDQGSEFSENLEDFKHNTDAGKSEIISAASKGDVSRMEGKKKAPRIVPSRYMQPVNKNTKGPLKATDSRFLGKTMISGGPSVNAKQKQQSILLNKTRVPNTALRKAGSATQLNSATPETRGVRVSASTPNADDTVFFGNAHVDVSVIPVLPPGRRFGPNSQATRVAPNLALFPFGASGDGSSDVSRIGTFNELDSVISAHGQKTRKNLNEVNQWSLELLYARHLQWAFLASKARKTLHEQEKQAMEQLSNLTKLNNKHDGRVVELELELEKLRHVNALDEALDLQFSGLTCSTNKLPNLKDQHRHLAEALDTTRHHIPTRGIYIPENDEQYLEGIARALNESEQLLGEISSMTQTQAQGIDQCGKVLQTMEKIVDKETNRLARCNSLLSAAATLVTQENSLMVQQIQTRQ